MVIVSQRRCQARPYKKQRPVNMTGLAVGVCMSINRLFVAVVETAVLKLVQNAVDINGAAAGGAVGAGGNAGPGLVERIGYGVLDLGAGIAAAAACGAIGAAVLGHGLHFVGRIARGAVGRSVTPDRFLGLSDGVIDIRRAGSGDNFFCIFLRFFGYNSLYIGAVIRIGYNRFYLGIIGCFFCRLLFYNGRTLRLGTGILAARS